MKKRIGKERIIDYLLLLLILLLTAYQTIELTRIIILNGWTLFPDFKESLCVEIAYIWTTYIVIIPVFIWTIRRKR
jgi:hypothetical protein